MRGISAPRGTDISCRSWPQEAAMRMLMNNLDPEVAERPDDLIVYGGTGKAARDWDAYQAIVNSLRELGDEQTLLVQSGKPVGVFQTHELAPRVLIANSLLVPHWATWEKFRELEGMGLTMFGQMTAGSWIYIGTQGIIQGTYETLAAVADRHFGGSLRGRLVITAGLGGMGGAQPLAVTMNGGVAVVVEVDRSRIERRLRQGFVDAAETDVDRAVALALEARCEGRPLSIALEGNAADIHPLLVRRGIVPDIATDQTSAHDPIDGYVPKGMDLVAAERLRERDPGEYERRSLVSMAEHCEALVNWQRQGAVVFDYGNNLRGHAQLAGYADAFSYPGFVPAYIRPLFCEGKGPFRWVALSGDPADIHRTDQVILEEMAEDRALCRWIRLAARQVPWQGLPARICWLGYGDRDRIGLRFNDLVRRGELRAPIVIGRDHLDAGSVASPHRETEQMIDGSDAIGDWPVLNALLNTACGASWVSVHHGGGVGIGYSLHAGMVVVADGTDLAEKRLGLVLRADPGTGVIRHADAGYGQAIDTVERHGLSVPMPLRRRDGGEQ